MLNLRQRRRVEGTLDSVSKQVSAPAQATVAVLGYGVIGASWGEAFLNAGLQLRVWDPRPNAAGQLKAEPHGRMAVFVASPREAVQGAVFVQESGPEDLATKRSLYGEIASALAPDAIVASSTSTFQPSALQAGCAFAERLLVGHPFNPPHILPLVEIVPGAATDPLVADRAMAFYRDIGKHPILLRRERAGHLVNRLQAALWREALDAVASGQASVADVDTAVRLSLGPRWAVQGPFATFHLGGGSGGLAHFLDHLGTALEELWDDAQRPRMTDSLRARVLDGVAASVAGRSPAVLQAARDEALKAVLAAAARELCPPE